MKTILRRSFAALSTAMLVAMSAWTPAKAAFKFDQTEINQDKVVAIAVPRGIGGHSLLILEQVSNQKDCWKEMGATPTVVDPLLLNFDFTGICGRATDSNGYSLRMAGVDLGLEYTLSLQNSNGDIKLMATPRNASAKPVVIGRTNGITDGMLKISLDPGWRFTKRAYQGTTLGHFYLTSDKTADGVDSNPTPLPTPSKFRDIASDIYKQDIEEAVNLGFVAGFADSTFRPQTSLTREQLVSLVLESLKNVPGVNVNLPANVSARPFFDINTDRWSAAKIKFAKDNKIISGYEDGTFQPERPVTRAELMAVLRRASEFALTAQGKSPELNGQQPAKTFTDTNRHWAEPLIGQMSSYCGVASPLNEVGTRFEPDSAAKRNYAAAATLRMLKCVKPQQQQ